MGVTNVAEVGWALTNQECEGAWLRSAERNVWAWSVWRRGLSVWAIWVCEMGRIDHLISEVTFYDLDTLR